MKKRNPEADGMIHTELTGRVREALLLKDWTRLEHWAKQWIMLAPAQGVGFKWLARAYLAQNKMQNAAYAYGRLLDFEGNNDEARNFFAQYPSTLLDQPQAVENLKKAAEPEPKVEGHVTLTPEQRRQLSSHELKLGEAYEQVSLHSEASARYARSFEWHPNQKAALGHARCLHRAHRGLEAAHFLRLQLQRFQDWNEGRILLARVLFELGHAADAQREWQTVLRFDPENRDALGFLRTLHMGG